MGNTGRAKSCSRNFQTQDPEVGIRVVWPDRNDELRVTGYPVDSKGKRIKAYGYTTRISKGLEDREGKIAEVRAEIERKVVTSNVTIKQSIKRVHSTKLDEHAPMVATFRVFKETNPYVQGWGESTLHMKLTYFEQNILPFIQHFENDEEFDEKQLDSLKHELINRVINHGNSDHRLDTATKRVEDHIADARRIYSELVYLNGQLPDLQLLKGKRLELIKREQFKYIPPEIHRAFRNLLETYVETNPRYVRGAVLMDAGLRSAEAAVVTKNELQFTDLGTMVFVLFQEKNGYRSKILKSEAAYRVVPVDEWITHMLQRCNELIKDELNDDEKVPVTGAKLSHWTKSVLIESGCTAELLRAAQQDMGEQCEYDHNGVQSTDISGHMLRRNRASLMATFMGYMDEEIRLVLGHANGISRRIKERMLTSEYMSKLFVKNTRYDWDGANWCSSPKYVPIEVKPGMNINIIPFEEYRMKIGADDEIELTFNIEACVVNEKIEVVTNGQIQDVIVASVLHSADMKHYNTEIIGRISCTAKDERGGGD